MLTRRGAAHTQRTLSSAPPSSSRHGTDGTAAETTGGQDRARKRPVANPCPRAARVNTHRCPRSERVPNGKPPRPHPHAPTGRRRRRASLRPARTHTAAHRSLGHVPKHEPCQPVPRATTPIGATAIGERRERGSHRLGRCRTICEHSRRNAHGRVTTLAVQHEVVTPSPATASDGGAGWARCDVECLVQTWLSRKSAPTGSPLQEHDVGVGRGEPSGVARIPAPAGKVRKSDIFGNL